MMFFFLIYQRQTSQGDYKVRYLVINTRPLGSLTSSSVEKESKVTQEPKYKRQAASLNSFRTRLYVFLYWDYFEFCFSRFNVIFNNN